jgi:hypothetical protein
MSSSVISIVAAAATTKPMNEALYQKAAGMYVAFVTKVKALVEMEHDPTFGTQVLKPSQLLQLRTAMLTRVSIGEQVARAMRSPIYDTDMKLIALSIDADGSTITEAQFKSEFPTRVISQASLDAHLQPLIDLCNATNSEIKAWTTAHGVTVVDFYHEYNRRGDHWGASSYET